MFKLLKLFVMALLLFSISYASSVTDVTQTKLKEIKNLELFQKAQITVLKVYDAGSLYILDTSIQENRQELLLTKDKLTVITGKAIDVKTGRQIIIPVDMSVLNGKEAVTYGTGSEEYYVFTDPECPYCKKFESFYPQIKDKVTLKIFFYPLSFHKNAREMSLYVLSKKGNEERVKTMLAITPNSKEYVNRKIDDNTRLKLEAILDEHINIAQNLNVSGTPSVYDKEGRKISWAQLLMSHGVNLE